MLSSMTAYGHSRIDDDVGEFFCEIRSVNHRYLDIRVRLDDPLHSAEPILRDRISARLGRGKLDVSLIFNPSSEASGQLTIDHRLLDDLLDTFTVVSGRCSTQAPLDIVKIMQWPGVVRTERAESDQLLERAKVAFDQALEDHVNARRREGEQIRSVLEFKAKQLQQIVTTLRAHRPEVVARQREKLLSRLQQISIEFDHGRLEQELVYTAQRLDIDEELDRLDVHLLELFNVLDRSDVVGRRLDFLMQEFNREANTVASKSNDSDTTAHSVNMKVLIEQMREQVQNVE